MQSCYASQQKAANGQSSSTQQATENAVAAAVCPSPTWFYSLLAIAAAAGIMKGGRK